MNPEQASFLLNAIFLPALKNESRVTKLVMQSIPDGKGDYRPDPNAKSAMELAWHIAAAENRFLEGIASGAFDFNPNHKPDSIITGAGIAAWYNDSTNANIEKLSKVSGEQLAKVIDFRGVLQLPAVAYCQITLHHSVHHRGQLSTYLRPMGGSVPAIYGESYDSARAKASSAS
jgi:uncharacterized damage-inducible protein DinB